MSGGSGDDDNDYDASGDDDNDDDAEEEDDDDGVEACSECDTFSTCLNCSNRVGSILSNPFNITAPTALPFRSTSPATGKLTAKKKTLQV